MALQRLCCINKSADDNENFHNYRRLKSSKEKSKFEYLPNELLLIIFEYLYCHDIIYAFNNLNFRFQFLLHSYEYYHLSYFDIKIKSKYNLIQQLPLHIQHIKSLTLSNNNYSFLNIEQYFSIYSIELFYPKLESLSLIDSNDTQLTSLIFLLPNFQQLKSLSISQKHFLLDSLNTRKRIRYTILFQIKTLKYLTWNVISSFFNTTDEILLEQKSNINHYRFYEMQIADFEWLNIHTVDLKSISVHRPLFFCQVHRQQTFETLIFLKLNNMDTYEHIQFLFEHLTCLTKLKQLELQGHFHDKRDYIDGYKWRDFIEKYIPQLIIFKFLFILNDRKISTTIDTLIQSFMTEFWLIEKKWFITCDHHLQNHRIDIYTVPYMNKQLEYSISYQRKSTAKMNDTSNIHQLILSPIKTQQIITNDRFINLQSLTIRGCSEIP